MLTFPHGGGEVIVITCGSCGPGHPHPCSVPLNRDQGV